MGDTDEQSCPDRGREHIEVLRETIDRNRDFEWDDYRDEYSFVLVDDGLIRVTQAADADEDADDEERAVEDEVDHLVSVDESGYDCNCHIAQRPFGRETCRHIRAVKAHPRL